MAPSESGSKPMSKSSFVDLTSALGGEGVATTTVELSRSDGTRLSLRLGGGNGIDVQSLISAFCQPSR